MSLVHYSLFSFYCSLLHTLSQSGLLMSTADVAFRVQGESVAAEMVSTKLLDMDGVWLSPPLHSLDISLRWDRYREKAFWLMSLAWRCNKVKLFPFFGINKYPKSQTHPCILLHKPLHHWKPLHWFSLKMKNLKKNTIWTMKSSCWLPLACSY